MEEIFADVSGDRLRAAQKVLSYLGGSGGDSTADAAAEAQAKTDLLITAARRLIFLKHPDVVRVVDALGSSATLRDALVSCDVAESRWPAFERAFASLIESEMLHERALVG